MPRVVHFEIPAEDTARAKTFYETVFGWKIEKWNGPEDYWLITTGHDSELGIDGAIMHREEPIADGGLTAYFCTVSVDNIDTYAEKVKANKGKVVKEKTEIPGIGWWVSCIDTEGNHFGILQPSKQTPK